ncbi:uncharacterized protein LOC142337127 isoform X1 [Convolutriloba macropyga]|uniref:uncharacterized protein LOC142337127 isoform X1 n=1 Tax=Convolutriloba macropyga TaxID=536237 RepID=UPI003F524795
MSFWAFEGKMGLDDMAPFFVISKHSELFQDINPPKYTEYEDLPNDDVELSEVVQYIEGLVKPFELYLNSWIKKLDNRNAKYEFEAEEAAARKKYDLLYRDEKKRAVDAAWDQWPGTECKLSGSFELLEVEVTVSELSKLFYTRYTNKKLFEFLKKVDACVAVCICRHAGSQRTIRVGDFNSYNRNVKSSHGLEIHQAYQIQDVPDNFDELIEPFVRISNSKTSIRKRSNARRQGIRYAHGTAFKELSECFGSGDAVSADFKNRLERSWKSYRDNHWQKGKKILPNEPMISTELSRTNSKAEETENELMKILIPDKRQCVASALFESGLLLRLSPLALVPLLLYLPSNAQNDWRLLLGALLVRRTEQQRLRRCLQHLRNKHLVHLEREWGNQGHSNWVPRDYVEWLMLEAEGNFLIRPVQVKIALQMLVLPECIKNAVMQLNMGEGKSSVIVPMLICTVSLKHNVCPQVIVLGSLYPLNCNYLAAKMGGILNLALLQLPFCRDLQLRANDVDKLSEEILALKKRRGFIVSTPEQIMSMKLKTIEMFISESSPKIESFRNFSTVYEQNVRSILDESDDILSVKRQLVYTLGSQMPLDGNNERWKVIQSVLKSLNEHSGTIAAECGPNFILHQLKTDKNQHQFNLFRLLSKNEQSFNVISKLVVADFIEGKTDSDLWPLTPVQKSYVQKFVFSEELENDQGSRLERELGGVEIPPTLFILRGLFGLKILQHCLTLRHRVNYGIGKHRKMAVPFRAKDIAVDKTDFGHPDVALTLTQLTYYYQGVPKEGFQKVLLKLSQLQPSIATSIYAKWISMCDRCHIPKELRSFSSVNPSDVVQLGTLYGLLYRHILVVDYWLETFVYPQEARQFRQKLSANGWDLCRQGELPVTGFSGTNETQLLLPLTIEQCDLPELEETNALVINNILRKENQNYYSINSGASSYDILDMVISVNTNNQYHHMGQIKVILDPGAIILEANKKFVSLWLDKIPENEISAGVYFDDEDNLVVLDRRGFVTPYHLSPFAGKLESCVVYLDDVHTRGTDLQFPSGTRAAVTLGTCLSKDKLAQACMRMRLLGSGHSLSFFASSEVDNEIQSISGSSKVSQVGKVIAWAFKNSQNQVRDGIVHWANQATDQLHKLCSYQSSTLDGVGNQSLARFGNDIVHHEITSLSQIYGKNRTKNTLPDLVSQRIENLQCPNLQKEFKQKLLKRCRDVANDKKVFSDLFDEEQERELEREQEEEEEIERPYPMKPKISIVPDCVKRLVTEAIVKPDEFVNLNECLKHTILENRIPGVFNHVLASPEFPKVILQYSEMASPISGPLSRENTNASISNRSQQRQGANPTPLDKFLRNPFWAVQLNPPRSNFILLTPFEVNSLFNELRKMRHATLFMFQPYFQKPLKKLGALHEMTGFSIPIGKRLVFKNFVQFSELNVFAGNLYFDSLEKEKWMCRYLGLLPLPRTEAQQHAFERNLIDVYGFVHPRNRTLVPGTHDWWCPFQTNPVEAVMDLIVLRNVDTLYMFSHMHKLLSKCHSNFLQ